MLCMFFQLKIFFQTCECKQNDRKSTLLDKLTWDNLDGFPGVDNVVPCIWEESLRPTFEKLPVRIRSNHSV